MSTRLLPPSFLFRFAIPCRHKKPLWTPSGAGLDESYALPWLTELDEARSRSELRAAWSEQGLAFQLRVSGKRQPPWCRDSRPDESDGLRLWIDTRDTRNVHRATRFCHQFMLLPSGAGRALDEPHGEPMLINRAKEHPKPIRQGAIQLHREKRVDGYILDILITAAALTGFDPVEHPRLGFMCAVIDRERGHEVYGIAPEFPYQDDPSLWLTLELVGPE